MRTSLELVLLGIVMASELLFHCRVDHTPHSEKKVSKIMWKKETEHEHP